jgi:hypothetical protein
MVTYWLNGEHKDNVISMDGDRITTDSIVPPRDLKKLSASSGFMSAASASLDPLRYLDDGQGDTSPGDSINFHSDFLLSNGLTTSAALNTNSDCGDFVVQRD